MKTTTPETDKAAGFCDYVTATRSAENGTTEVVSANFARKLERERDEARLILNTDKLSPVAKMWQRCFAAEEECQKLRKLCERQLHLIVAVTITDMEGAVCKDVLGKNWFDAREEVITAFEGMK